MTQPTLILVHGAFATSFSFAPLQADELDRAFRYPGPMYRFSGTPWGLQRAPLLGEHQERLG